MNNLYIDCGTHLGEGLKKHIKEYNIDKNWVIDTFEANTNTFNILKQIREENKTFPTQYEWINWNNINYHNIAISTFDGVCDFFCSKVKDFDILYNNENCISFKNQHDEMVNNGDLITKHQRNDYPIDGSSTLHPYHLKRELHLNGDLLQKNLSWENKIQVKCLNFSKWLKQKIDGSYERIICKIDIEGEEFNVLEKCIKEGTLNLITELNVEFHYYTNNSLYDRYQYIKNYCKFNNINLNEWN